MQTLKPYLKLSRWREYYGKVLVVTSLGVFITPNVRIWQIILLVVANLLANVFAFMINDLEDSEDDAKHKEKRLRNPIASGEIDHRKAQLATYSTGIFCVMLYFILGFRVGLVGALIMFIGLVYSHKKIRLKSKPIIDITSHGMHRALLFLTPVVLPHNNPSILLTLSIGFCIFLVSALGDISNEIRDYRVDREAGLKNTASYFNLLRLKQFLVVGMFIPCAYIFLFIMVYAPGATKLILLATAMFIAVDYYLKWHRKNKTLGHSVYSQVVLSFIGFIILISPENLNVLHYFTTSKQYINIILNSYNFFKNILL